MKQKIIKLEEIDNLVIAKMPIGKYADVLRCIKKLPKHLVKLENLSVEKILEILPDILSDSLPDLLEILSVATDLDVSTIEKMGLDDISLMVAAIFEVNNYSQVYKLLKKGLAHQKTKKLIEKAK